jgi:hypothetical protein
MSPYYTTAEVCLEGHPTTGSTEIHPERRKKYCDKCGSETITACPTCKAPIRGDYHGNHLLNRLLHPPGYCHSCGKPYPWTESKIQAAIQIFMEFGDLQEAEKQTIAADIQNIAKGTPASELSALRVKRIWSHAGKIAYDVLMEFASKTAAEVLKNP